MTVIQTPRGGSVWVGLTFRGPRMVRNLIVACRHFFQYWDGRSRRREGSGPSVGHFTDVGCASDGVGYGFGHLSTKH